jgi:hypothetical protein
MPKSLGRAKIDFLGSAWFKTCRAPAGGAPARVPATGHRVGEGDVLLGEAGFRTVSTTSAWSDGDTALGRRMADLTEEHTEGPYEFV